VTRHPTAARKLACALVVIGVLAVGGCGSSAPSGTPTTQTPTMSAEQVAFAQYLAKIRPGMTYAFRADIADARWAYGDQDYRSRKYDDALRRASDLYRKAFDQLGSVKPPRALRTSQRDAVWAIFVRSRTWSNFTGWIMDMRVGVAEGDPITPADWKQGYKEFEYYEVQDWKEMGKARAAWLDDIATEAKQLGVPWPEKWFTTLDYKAIKAERKALDRMLAD
jgi:hypothetical protein